LTSNLTIFNLKASLTPQTSFWLRQVRMAAALRDNLPGLRQRIETLSKALTSIAAGKEALTVAQIDGMADVILEFVLLPQDRTQARELILDLSCEELARMIEAITASLT